MSESERELGRDGGSLEDVHVQTFLSDFSMRHLISLMGENVAVKIGGERHFVTVTDGDGLISCVVKNAARDIVLDFSCDATGRLLTVDLPKNARDVAYCLSLLVKDECVSC